MTVRPPTHPLSALPFNEKKDKMITKKKTDNEAETDHTSPNQETPPISPPHKTSEQPENPPPAAAPRGGRRRGRRQVMKKKTIKDEEGYLGTCVRPSQSILSFLFTVSS